MVWVQRVGELHKAEVATEWGCTVRDVDAVLAKYEWAKEANRRVMKLKEEGKPLPKSLDEVSLPCLLPKSSCMFLLCSGSCILFSKSLLPLSHQWLSTVCLFPTIF